MFKLTYLKLYYQDFLEDGTYIIRYHCFVFYQKLFQHFLILLASFNFFKKNSRSFLLKYLKLRYFIHNFFVFLIVLMTINKVNALSAVTVREVIGSLPYITFDDGQTKITKLSSLLVMKNPDGRVFIPENDVTILFPNSIVDSSNPRNPIEVPTGTRWQDIGTFVPLGSGNGYNSNIDLNSLVGLNQHWQDPDGDGNFYATGNLALIWQDSSGADVSSIIKAHPDWLVDPCNSPYRLTVSVTNSDLSTQYGIPRIGVTNGSSHTYYFRPKITTPYVCYARPGDTPNNYAPLQDVNGARWVAGQGFTVDLSDQWGRSNFPRTGSNNLFFDLVLAGVTAQEVFEGYGSNLINGHKPPKAVGTIAGPYKVVQRPKLQLSIAPNQDVNTGNRLRVTLKGPAYNRNDNPKVSTYGTQFFDIYHMASGTLLYKFTLLQWHVVVPDDVVKASKKPEYICTTLDGASVGKEGEYFSVRYQYPRIHDLTNANAYTWSGGIPGRNINNYRREIGRAYAKNTGFFNEWGIVNKLTYPDSDWEDAAYYAHAKYRDPDPKYYVASWDGAIIPKNNLQESLKRVDCISPYNDSN